MFCSIIITKKIIDINLLSLTVKLILHAYPWDLYPFWNINIFQCNEWQPCCTVNLSRPWICFVALTFWNTGPLLKTTIIINIPSQNDDLLIYSANLDTLAWEEVISLFEPNCFLQYRPDVSLLESKASEFKSHQFHDLCMS